VLIPWLPRESRSAGLSEARFSGDELKNEISRASGETGCSAGRERTRRSEIRARFPLKKPGNEAGGGRVSPSLPVFEK